MASLESPPRTIALIHNSELPPPLNVLSTAIAEFSKECYFDRRASPNYAIHIIDLATYSIPPTDSLANSRTNETDIATNLKSSTEWEAEISKHCAFILLFPYHTWSHCTPLKNALSILPPHLIHKPALLMGFGKEEPYCAHDYERTWKKTSFDMMRDFLLDNGVKLVGMEQDGPNGWPVRGWPEFRVYADYWENWIKGNREAFIGGQQAEAWERKGDDRCQRGIAMLISAIEKNRTLELR
ncbi:hypothetical protein VTL71DRAFT_4900 [Oculimacula yallundae]|uniref:Uncharacterized protein n=1 Tax=Oculimacula yallundae TaxID=86028 RepID=A0ABR4C3B0_9HELO